MDYMDQLEMEMRWNRMSRRERAVLRRSHPELREFIDEQERLSHRSRLWMRRFWLLATAVIGLLAMGYVVKSVMS
jgi:hypothetical protein